MQPCSVYLYQYFCALQTLNQITFCPHLICNQNFVLLSYFLNEIKWKKDRLCFYFYFVSFQSGWLWWDKNTNLSAVWQLHKTTLQTRMNASFLTRNSCGQRCSHQRLLSNSGFTPFAQSFSDFAKRCGCWILYILWQDKSSSVIVKGWHLLRNFRFQCFYCFMCWKYPE